MCTRTVLYARPVRVAISRALRPCSSSASTSRCAGVKPRRSDRTPRRAPTRRARNEFGKCSATIARAASMCTVSADSESSAMSASTERQRCPQSAKRAAADFKRSSRGASVRRGFAARARARTSSSAPSRGSVLMTFPRSIGAGSASYVVQRRARSGGIRHRRDFREQQQCDPLFAGRRAPVDPFRDLFGEGRVLARASALAERLGERAPRGERPHAPRRRSRHLLGSAHLAKRGVAVAVVRELPGVTGANLHRRYRHDRRGRIPRVADAAALRDAVRARHGARAKHQLERGNREDRRLHEVGVTFATEPIRVDRRMEQRQGVGESVLGHRDVTAQLRRARGDDVGAGGLRLPRETFRRVELPPRPVRERARVGDLGSNRAVHAGRVGLRGGRLEHLQTAIDFARSRDRRAQQHAGRA